MPARIRRAVCAAAAAGTLTAVGLAGLPTMASAAPQTTAGSAVSLSAVSLSAVSCPSSAWCMVVGSFTPRSGVQHALAQFWNGRSWRVLRPPGSALSTVSCPAAGFCLARGGPTGTERWNGRTWQAMRSAPYAVTAPSCGSRSLCMVINGSSRGNSVDFAESWNGRRWRTWWQTGICFGPPGLCALNAVSCGSASTCVAVGFTQFGPANSSTRTDSVIWDGKGWAVSQPPSLGAPAWLTAVSCTAAFCMATGVGYSAAGSGYLPIASAWDKATRSWRDVSPDLGVVCAGFTGICAPWASTVSCGSASNCMTFGPSGNQAWNGTTWTPAPSISVGHGSALEAAGCGGTICMAVGFQTIARTPHTLAELWNGTNWQILTTPKIS